MTLDTEYILGSLVVSGLGHCNNLHPAGYGPSAADWLEFDEGRLPSSTSVEPISVSQQLVPDLGSCSATVPTVLSTSPAAPKDRETGTCRFSSLSTSSDWNPEEVSNQMPRHQSVPCQWSQCGKRFTDSKRLHEHAKAHTEVMRDTFKCHWSGCSETRSSRCLLNKHLKTHTKPFQCSEPSCHHSAANGRDLQRHIRTHGTRTGDSSFFCPYQGCEHSQDGDKEPFKRQDHAKRHIRRKHPNYPNPPIPIIT